MILDLYLLCVTSVDVKVKCCKLCRLLDQMYGVLDSSISILVASIYRKVSADRSMLQT